ncbi:hypothetical protein [Tenacibaculum sp. 190524A02b]|uniref:hypothetical protein n=1 Tax=Tenacibaculum vairaonense TaxID=3137860 RepID=UPI0031FB34D4
MAERIKILEADIDLEKLLKKGAEAKKSIEFLKNEVKFFQNSIKEGKGLIYNYQESLSKMEKQGEKNTKEYKLQESNLKILVKSQEENRQKLELIETNLRRQQKSYRLTKKGIDSYNKAVEKEIEVIDKTDGSITQLEHALAQNRKAYRDLTTEQRENLEVGGKLFKLISQQDQEYKELQKSIGSTQVDVGNYKEQIRELFYENANLSKTFQQQIEQIPIVGSLLGGVYNILLKYAQAQRAAIASTKGSTRALKLFKLALLGTGIGVIIVALGSLITFLTTTQKGINKVNSVLIPLKIILQSLFGVIQNMGEVLFNTFTSPKQAIKALWKEIKTNLINRITAIGGVFKALGKIISSGFTDGYKDLANSSIQAVTGIENVIEKTKGLAGEAKKFFSEAYKRGQRIAEIQRLLSAGEADFIVKLAEGKEAFKEQNKVAEDQTKTLTEREGAALKSIELLKETNNEQRKRNALELELLQLKAASNDTSDEDRAEIARKVAELKEANAQLLEAETTQQNKLNTIRKEANNKAISAAKKRIDAEIKSSQVALNRYILENDKINSSLDKRLKFYQSALKKESNILKQQLDANKITQEEYELALLEKKKEYTDKINEATISNLEKELDLYIAQNRSKIENDTLLTDELVKGEEARLQEIFNRKLEILEEQKENELISEQDFNIRKLELQYTHLEQKKELGEKFNEENKEREQLEYENDIEIRRLRGESEFQLRYEELERLRVLEIEQAKKKGLDIQKVDQKFSLKKKELEKQVTDFKLQQRAAILSGFKNLLGEEGKLGKAFAIAEIINTTVQNATKAFTQAAVFAANPLTLPLAANANIQGGIIVATGAAQVAKTILPKAERGAAFTIGGNLHSHGGTKFFGEDGTAFEAEKDETMFILNRRASAAIAPLLSDLNQHYGGDSLYNGKTYLSSGGSVLRGVSNQTQSGKNKSFDYDLLAGKIAEANKELPPNSLNLEYFNDFQSDLQQIIIGASR